MANHKLLSGRVKVTPAANVAADRYNYLGLEQAEPNLGVANADGFVLTYNTNSPGGRLWQSSSLLSGGLVAQSAFQTANNAEALSTSAYIHANAAFDKAKEIQKNRWRTARKPILEKLDTQFMRAVETGDTAKQQQIATQKQALRDVTTTDLSSVTNTEELKNVWPDILNS